MEDFFYVWLEVTSQGGEVDEMIGESLLKEGSLFDELVDGLGGGDHSIRNTNI